MNNKAVAWRRQVSSDSDYIAAQDNELTDRVVSLALLGRTEDMADAAQYLEKQPGHKHHAILLYHKACHF